MCRQIQTEIHISFIQSVKDPGIFHDHSEQVQFIVFYFSMFKPAVLIYQGAQISLPKP